MPHREDGKHSERITDFDDNPWKTDKCVEMNFNRICGTDCDKLIFLLLHNQTTFPNNLVGWMQPCDGILTNEI